MKREDNMSKPNLKPVPLRPVESYERPNGVGSRTPNHSGPIVRRVRHPYAIGALAGILGAAVMTLVELVAQFSMGSPLSLELLLGSIFTGRTDASAWVLGFLWHLANGALFGLVYSIIFRNIFRADATLGLGFGVVHWVIGGILVGAFSAMNPFIPALLPPAGFFAAGYGIGPALQLLLMHLIFGAIVGSAYRASGVAQVPSRVAQFDERRRAA
ncbi:MAG: hypothetical protein A2X94_14720 [Bdellovibrionales bacterium GWB1_55_8]|nr:MAG: hypothetical protein A2X94_14720 [Bdellovibrionales bacterium GWB1_55_8]